MRICLLTAVMSATMILSLTAQERTASGNLQVESSWTALKVLVDAAQGTARTAQITADSALAKANRIEICNRKGLLYGPGVSGSDADDCISPALLNNVLNCGNQNLIYNRNANSCAPASVNTPAPSCSLEIVMSGIKHVGGREGQNVPLPCPAGYRVTGATGGSDLGQHYCTRINCR